MCNVAVDETARPRVTERGSRGSNGWTSDEKKRVRLGTDGLRADSYSLDQK